MPMTHAAVEDGGRVVEVTRARSFREAKDGRHRVAGERGQESSELTALHVDRDLGWAWRIVGQPAQDGLGTAEDLDALGFAPGHSCVDVVERLEGTRRKKRRLVRGDLHEALTCYSTFAPIATSSSFRIER